MRLASSMFLSALFKRVAANGGFATMLKRGNEEAGAIFVVERSRSSTRFFGPAPQALFMETEASERLFECLAENFSENELQEMIARQTRFDPDCYVVEIEGCSAQLPVNETQLGATDVGQGNNDELDAEIRRIFTK